jgi:integrase
MTAPPPCGAAAGERARSTRPPTARPPVTTRLPGAGRRYLDLHNLRNRNWKPAQRALGIDPIRRVSDLGHTFATFALRAGISTFDRSRYMSASLTIIDRHYGHPTKDGRDHAIALLDAQNIHDVHAVEARWTRRKGSSTPGCPGTTA